MGIFSNPEYQEVVMPITYLYEDDDIDAGCLSFEAHGVVGGEHKYFYVSLSLNHKYMDDIDEMSDLLLKSPEKTVKVIFKIKDGKIKRFTFDLDSMAEAYNDDRLRSMEAAGWGSHDKSIKELDKK